MTAHTGFEIIKRKHERCVVITECREDEWGELCNNKCGNCLELPCNITTGHCLHGCNGSWVPPLCTQGRLLYGNVFPLNGLIEYTENHRLHSQ